MPTVNIEFLSINLFNNVKIVWVAKIFAGWDSGTYLSIYLSTRVVAGKIRHGSGSTVSKKAGSGSTEF